jgi:hypothetical protein
MSELSTSTRAPALDAMKIHAVAAASGALTPAR